MIDLKQYRENASKNDLCSEYSTIWDRCASNKQIMDMALGVKGADYICDTIAKGWGISPSAISDRFVHFINGKYTYDNKYTSKMYCQFNGEIVADTTILQIIECKCGLVIPDNGICEVYVTGNSNISVSGNGRCVFVCYGNLEDITITGECGNMKRVNKKERDKYTD